MVYNEIVFDVDSALQRRGIMQYFSFLGTGTNQQYAIADYHLENSHEVVKTEFVQEAISRLNYNQIDEVYVLCTQKSKETFENRLVDHFKEISLPLHFIEITENVSVEEIVEKVGTVLTSDFMMDITHSYRSIPMSVMMIVKYLELAKNVRLIHLYYGNYNRDTHEGIIYDLIDSYNQSLIVEELQSFDRFLTVSTKSLYRYEDDEKLKQLIHAFDQFNHMLEYCDFEQSLQSIKAIVERCRSILKVDSQYVLIKPYLRKIIEKLEPINNSVLAVDKKMKLVKLLINHHQTQMAITFTDQLIREEFVHFAYFSQQRDFKSGLLERGLKVYDLSQDLFVYWEIRPIKDKYRVNDQVLKYRKNHLQPTENYKKLNADLINGFYNNIRNKVNHGVSIDLKTDVTKTIEACLDNLREFVARR